MKVFAINNPDLNIRLQSSAGGVFSMLAEKVISKKGVIYGASFSDNWHVMHRRVDSFTEIDSIRRSKYVFSNLTGLFDTIDSDLKKGKEILFCSTPCQVAAIKKRFKKHTNLLCVEVVCHGAPKPKFWELYLIELCKSINQKVENISSINFRDKATGWKNYSFTIKFKDDSVFSELHDDNLFMKAFLANYTLRNACFNCKFKYPYGSRADITIGDYWGISQETPEIDNDMGTSLLITRTTKGEELIKDFLIEKELSFDSVVKHNPAITTSSIKPKDIDLFIEKFYDGTNLLELLERFTRDNFILRIKKILNRIRHK